MAAAGSKEGGKEERGKEIRKGLWTMQPLPSNAPAGNQVSSSSSTWAGGSCRSQAIAPPLLVQIPSTFLGWALLLGRLGILSPPSTSKQSTCCCTLQVTQQVVSSFPAWLLPSSLQPALKPATPPSNPDSKPSKTNNFDLRPARVLFFQEMPSFLKPCVLRGKKISFSV